LMPNQSVPIYVNFGPSTSGFAGGTLNVKSNASNPLVQVSVSGTGITGQVSGHNVALSWTPASGVVGYFIYRSTVSGGPYTKLNAVLDTQPSFMDSGLQSGNYFYVVTSVTASGVESGFSSELEVTVP
jgi:fibronectin type 3 domain-containing protein